MITVDMVADHLGMSPTDPGRNQLAPAVAAVNAQVAQWHSYEPGDEWTAPHILGGTMLAAHLYRRRNTPGGVENFNELGAVYVQRSDPHVSQLLGLGAWTPPRVG